MSIQIIAKNLKRIRYAMDISQQTLADQSGVSVQTIKKVELAQHFPRFSTLSKIAKALEVPTGELMRPVRVLQTVRFRSLERMRLREKILADISRKLEDFDYLESVLDCRMPSRIENIKAAEPLQAAMQCRKELGISDNQPIDNPGRLLQDCGIRLLPMKIKSPDFFGLSVGPKDLGPAIAINTHELITVERQIFSAFHELGHLILHRGAYDVSQTEQCESEENEANTFAGVFLMPGDALMKEWGETCGLPLLNRVYKIKRLFHVSCQTVLYRLVRLPEYGEQIRTRFVQEYERAEHRKFDWKKEPFGMEQVDFSEDRIDFLVRKAIEQQEITVSRGAEILGLSLINMRKRMFDWEPVQ